MDNMSVWASVEKTDPKYTKQFSRGGGFKGTATNATYLARKATERFGPCGTGWGITVLSEEVFQGAPHVIDGQVVAHDMIHKVHARLWYVLDGKRGEVEQFGQTQIVGRNKNGFYTDEEAPKKSLTDAMSKCLSLLGFSADIHLGLYDDNKYVAELRREFAPEPSSKVTPMHGVIESLPQHRRDVVDDVANTAREYLEGDDVLGALDYLERAPLEGAEEKAAVFAAFASYERAALKKAKDGDLDGAVSHLTRNRSKKEAA